MPKVNDVSGKFYSKKKPAKVHNFDRIHILRFLNGLRIYLPFGSQQRIF